MCNDSVKRCRDITVIEQRLRLVQLGRRFIHVLFGGCQCSGRALILGFRVIHLLLRHQFWMLSRNCLKPAGCKMSLIIICLSPIYFLGAGALALVIAWVTVYAHAWRVARTSPAKDKGLLQAKLLAVAIARTSDYADPTRWVVT